MTKEKKIKAIYENIADKTLSFGCKIMNDFGIFVLNTDNEWYLFYNYNWKKVLYNRELDKIIWHPVMIWDVLDYICNFKSIWILENILEDRNYYKKPIEEQSDECIDYVYNLIK